jgi:cardiolipin synthase
MKVGLPRTIARPFLMLLMVLLAACASTAQRPSPISSPCAGGDCAAGSGVSGVQLFVEPQAKEAPVLTAIRGATHSIWIEMYLITNLDVVYALEHAAHRGVETRVLLEMNPYGGGDVSPRLLSEKLTAAGVAVRQANPAFTLTHAKFMFVDSATAYIMTCNLTQSALGGSASATNREYLIVDTHAEDTAAVAAVAAIFQADWDRTQPVVNDANLVSDPAWRKALITNQASPPEGVPVFEWRGLADTLLDPSLSIGLVLRYCDSGANVMTEQTSGVGHGEAAIDDAPHYSQSLADMANGMAPTSDCGKPLSVPPAPPHLA